VCFSTKRRRKMSRNMYQFINIVDYMEFLNVMWKTVKFPLVLNLAPRHFDVWGIGGIAPLFLHLGTRLKWSASRPGRFTPGEEAPGTHWTGGWVNPTAGLDAEAERRRSDPCRESNPSPPACSQPLYWLSYPTSQHERWKNSIPLFSLIRPLVWNL
jgi:hypothetical protein